MNSNLNSDWGYYNVVIPNNTNLAIPANFDETRQQPIISNMQDFELSLVRLKVPAIGIPIFIFEEDPVTGISPYYVGFSIGSNYTNPIIQNVGFVAQYANNNFTTAPYNRFIFSYTAFLQMINNALLILFIAAIGNGAYAPLLPTLVNEQCPYLELDDITSYIKLILPVEGTAVAPTTSPFVFNVAGTYINIHFSKRLYYYLAGFNAKLLSIPPLPNMDYVLNIADPTTYDKVFTLPAYNGLPARPAIRIFQDYTCLYLWSSLTRILVTTSIPIEQELVGFAGAFGASIGQILLTDYEIPASANGDQRDYIYYFADFPRYQNFSANGDLKNFNLRIFFQTKDLQTYPVMLLPGSEASIKIQFRRRKARDQLQYSHGSLPQGGRR